MSMSFDQLFENTTRRVGNRLTRRSFVGRVALAMSAVGAGGLASTPSRALAAARSCGGCSNCGDSTTCGCTPCHGCPSNTCPGGAWYLCTSHCPCSTLTKYQDCISNGTCSFYCGCDGRPGCYYTTPYGACGGRTKVHCRSIT